MDIRIVQCYAHNFGGIMSFRRKVMEYFGENLGAVFIIGFILLLFASSMSMFLENLRLASDIAIYAFYSLIVGVVLQLYSFIKNPSQDENSST